LATKYELYVGTDQSLTNSGVAIWCPQTKKIVTYRISTKPDSFSTIFERLRYIEEGVTKAWQLWAEENIKVRAFFSEVPYLNSGAGVGRTNPKAYADLVRVETVLVMQSLWMNTPQYQMRVGTCKESWNRWLGSSGPKQVWRDLIASWDSEWLPEGTSLDESDALGVLFGGLLSLGIVEIPSSITTNEISRIKYRTREQQDSAKAKISTRRRSKDKSEDASGTDIYFEDELLSALGLSRV